MFLNRHIAAVLAFLLLCASASSQDVVTGALEGVIVGPGERPLAGATVTITSLETKQQTAVRSDRQGRFYQGLLLPGIYDLLVSAPGYGEVEIIQRVFTDRTGQVVPFPTQLRIKPPDRVLGILGKSGGGKPSGSSPDAGLGEVVLSGAELGSEGNGISGSSSRKRDSDAGSSGTNTPGLASGVLAVAAGPEAVIRVEAMASSGPSLEKTIPPDQALCIFAGVAPGKYRVEARRKGYDTATKEVEVSPAQLVPVTLTLESKEPEAKALNSGHFHALLIGNDEYRNLPHLKTAASDANEIAALLKDRWGFESKVLLNATREQIIAELSRYRRSLNENDSIVIYYAGHGYNDPEAQRAYWLPIDARLEDNANWISADDITADIRVIPARHVLVISDSCYSGTLARGLSMSSLETGSRERYLHKMFTGKSRNLLTSGGNEPVSDKEGVTNHSVFANSLIKGLEEKEVSALTAEELFHNYILMPVSGKSSQTPEYSALRNSGHEGGDFIFVRQGRN